MIAKKRSFIVGRLGKQGKKLQDERGISSAILMLIRCGETILILDRAREPEN
jgi:hypothetical protein